MSQVLRIGRVLGIPIELDLTCFIIFALITVFVATQVMGDVAGDLPGPLVWLLGGLTALLFFASLLAHELAHSYAARRHGTAVSSVRLFVFGGVARMEREPQSPREEWQMAAAGPACSVALAAFFAALAVWARLLTLGPWLAVASNWLAKMNGVLAAFNLLPGLPLDGGRLLRAGVWRLSGDPLRATRVAAGVGKATGFALIAWGGAMLIARQWWGVLSIFVGWLVVRLASAGYQQARLQRALQGVPVSRLMSRAVATVPADISVQQLVRDHLPRHARAAYLVLRGDQVVGHLSVRDLGDLPRERWPATPVGEIASLLGDDELVDPEADSWEALVQMARGNHRRLLVVRDGRLLGVLSGSDLVRVLHRPHGND